MCATDCGYRLALNSIWVTSAPPTAALPASAARLEAASGDGRPWTEGIDGEMSSLDSIAPTTAAFVRGDIW